MAQRTVVVLASVVLVLLVVSGGVLVADASTAKKIPDGVTVGGVDVGGLTSDDAREKVRTELLGKLRRPVRIVHSDKAWTLTPQTAKVDVDIDGAIAEAQRVAEDGNAFSRMLRKVTGGEVDREIATTSSYSRTAITALLNRVERGLHRDPQDASVAFTDGKLRVQRARVGLRLQRERVAGLVRKALKDPSAPHQISAYTHKQQPKVTNGEVRKKYGTVLVASRGTFQLKLYKNLKLVKTYGISVGKAGHDTPAGQYEIHNKAENPAWHVPNSAWAGDLAGTVVPPGPSNPIKARWLGIYDGVGIHGTSDDASIGTNASHGCLRMHVPDVIDLYPRVPVGTPIWIL